MISESIVAGVYEKHLDRESAFEKIKGRVETRQPEQNSLPSQAGTGSPSPTYTTTNPAPAAPQPAAPAGGSLLDSLGNLFGGGARRTRSSAGEQLIRSAASSIGREVGRQVMRGVMGSIFGGGRR